LGYFGFAQISALLIVENLVCGNRR
jgi:hypothetical protein